MTKFLKITAAVIAVLGVLAVIAIWQRHWIAFTLVSSGEQPDLLADFEEVPGGEWVDDYYMGHCHVNLMNA